MTTNRKEITNGERICRHLVTALQETHSAKRKLQSFSMACEEINSAEQIMFDLKLTIESLEGQLHQERKSNG